MRIEQRLVRKNGDSKIGYNVESIDMIENHRILIYRLSMTDSYLLIDEKANKFVLERNGVYIPNEVIEEEEFIEKVEALKEQGLKGVSR